MVVISQCPSLASEDLQVFYTIDPLLSNDRILIFYGSSNTSVANPSSNPRLQSHVFTPAGLRSYPRLAVSPNSPLYKAVTCLSREDQGDEVRRGLAYSLLKYFSELPEAAKDAWIEHSLPGEKPASAFRLFSEMHAAELAGRMVQASNARELLQDLDSAFATQSLSFIDADVVLPRASIQGIAAPQDTSGALDSPQQDASARYGVYAPLIKLLGGPAFLPTTRVHRTASRPTVVSQNIGFARAQKEKVRIEMCELVDTEDRYVSKMYDLVHSVAADFRAKADSKLASKLTSAESVLESIFPQCLDDILLVNSQFLEASRNVLEETENAAIEDIETTPDDISNSRAAFWNRSPDASGIVAFTKCLLTWFPRFAGCYTSYFEAHSQVGGYLRPLTSEPASSLSEQIHEIGEQRLMSMLIEPVQRLPRYNLYIDNIMKQLPIKHPALGTLLKAKDIIRAICAQDSSAQHVSGDAKLRNMIENWPAELDTTGCLISAADVLELEPPYRPDGPSLPSILLLFPKYVVIVRKTSDTATSASALQVEVDRPQSIPGYPLRAQRRQAPDLKFEACLRLDKTYFTETNGGAVVQLIPSGAHCDMILRRLDDLQRSNFASTKTYYLKGSYESKASQWIEECVQARVEGRFSATERGSPKWEVRSSKDENLDLTLFTAVFEEAEIERSLVAPLRILINPGNFSRKARPGQNGLEIVASIFVEGEGFYRLEVEIANERASRDLVTRTEFLPVLVRRLSISLQMRSQIRNPAVASYLLQHNHEILSSFQVQGGQIEHTAAKRKGYRPPSPVKAISNLIAIVSSRDTTTSKILELRAPMLGNIPQISTPSPPVKSVSEPNLTRKIEKAVSKVTLIGGNSVGSSIGPIEALESTLSSYILALHARKGNIVGRVVASRAAADEAEVIELYNMLLDQPPDHERAAQASVDVLFAAFENFLKLAWKEKMGPVIETGFLGKLQAKSDILSPLEFDKYLANALDELSPQNLRAFRSIINLLADLLEDMGNDGDRGALTAAVTEIVVSDERPHRFIPFFDRLVADSDVLMGQNHDSGMNTPVFDSSRTPAGTHIAENGSNNSKGSSLSKRFGMGSLRRENSKTESGSRVTTLLRQWSKGGRPTDNLVKSSTDHNIMLQQDAQPHSGRIKQAAYPTVFDTFSEQHLDQVTPRPTLGEIDLGSPFSSNLPNSGSTTPKRRKRRSSLSDLKTLHSSPSASLWTTPMSRIPDLAPQLPKPVQASPLTPSLIVTHNVEIPERSATVRYKSPNTKENITPVHRRFNTVRESPRAQMASEGSLHRPSPLSSYGNRDILSPPDRLLQRRSPSLIPISIPRGVLSERPSASNTPPPPVVPSLSKTRSVETAPSPTKLRIQSPQKIKERLQHQQKAIASTENSLHSDLSMIVDDFTKLSSRSHANDRIGGPASSPQKRNETLLMANLGTRIKGLESRVTHLIGNLQDQTTALEADLTGSLLVAERKARGLDQQLKQTNEENGALYDRNNEELMRVFNQVKQGRGMEELRAKLKESLDEAAKWKREVARLRRENVGLKTTAAVEGEIAGGVGMIGERRDGLRTLR